MSDTLLPFPQLLFQRLRKALKRLALECWQDPVPLVVERTVWRRGEFPLREAKKCPLETVQIPCAWTAEGFSTTWFKVSLPKGFKLRPGDHLHWDDNAEATAYANGQPIFGIDCTHRFWPWPKNVKELWLESLFCQSGIWHASAKGIGPAGSLLTSARLVRKNESAWTAYFDLEVLTDWLEEEVRRALPHETADQIVAGMRPWPEMDTAFSGMNSPDGLGTGVPNRTRPPLVKLPPVVRSIFNELSQALVVYYDKGSAALSGRLAKTYRLLHEQAAVLPRATVVGNSHLDLVWLWPEDVGEKKAVRNCSTVVRLMEENPDFRFCYSQPASYEAIARRQPELYQRMMRQIRRGSWEATGGMYVESDTLIGAGEPLLRSLYLGQKGFKRICGKPSGVLWLPDCFGFPGCLPALMRMCAIEGFFTQKVSWNMINAFPYNSFVWRGADGSEVMGHVNTHTVYNNPARVRNFRVEAEHNGQIDVFKEMLVPTGWGDGAGGPTLDIIERVRRQNCLRNQPSTRFGSVEDFYRRLKAVRRRLPVHQGEIYLEMHRGTYSTHGYVKAAYRESEKAMRAWEAAHALAGLGPVDESIWKRLVFSQFHDCTPGGSIQAVYDQIVPEMKRNARVGFERARAALSGTGAKGKFNPLPLPLPYIENGRMTVLPPLSVSRPECLPATPCKRLSAGARHLSNGRVNARFSAKGALVSLTVDGRSLCVKPPQPVVYDDVPYDHDAWEIDRDALYSGKPLKLIGLGDPEDGDGWVGLRQKWASRGGSLVEILWKLRLGGCVLEADVQMDWREPEKLLRFEIPTDYRGTHALFASPYGAQWRPQCGGDIRAAAMWEVPASRWAMASNDGRREGVFIAAEGKYGFACHDGLLSLTLLKSAKITVTNAFDARFQRGKAGPQYSDLGRQSVRMAIGLLEEDSPREEHPAALAETLFAVPLSVACEPRHLPISIEGLPSVIPSWVIPLGKDHFILRLHETIGRKGRIRLRAADGWLVRRLETAFPCAERGKPVGGTIAVGPNQIVSLEFSFEGT